jgi:hypothetical protein
MQVGGGQLICHNEGLRLALIGARASAYANAQLDDYGASPTRIDWIHRSQFRWQPPLRFSIRARTSGPLAGTAGFGFWNNPFSPLGTTLTLPATLWFFCGSPPGNLPFALGVPGHGWKAATLDATTPEAWRWAPLAPAVMLLNNNAFLERRIWPRAMRDLRIAEQTIETPDPEWRSYIIEWRRDGAMFSIDGREVFATEVAPQGPLGLVAWVDNQWMIATPHGRFGWGRLDPPNQWLDLADLQIESLE